MTYSLFSECLESNYSFRYPIPEGGDDPSYSFTILPRRTGTDHRNPGPSFARLSHSDLIQLPFGSFNIARQRITFTPNGNSALSDTSSVLVDGYFSGIVSSWRLESLGRLTFHGSAVRTGNGAIAVLGDKGVGKSTLTTFLVSEGFALLNDDMVVVRETEKGSFEALPGFPQLRNFPSVFDHLVPSEIDRFPVGDHTTKRWIRVGTGSNGFGEFCPEPRRLEAIYLLTRGEANKPFVLPVAGRDNFTTLTTFSYPVNLFGSLTSVESADRFHRVSRLMASVPVFKLSIPDSLDDLPRVADILRD